MAAVADVHQAVCGRSLPVGAAEVRNFNMASVLIWNCTVMLQLHSRQTAAARHAKDAAGVTLTGVWSTCRQPAAALAISGIEEDSGHIQDTCLISATAGCQKARS